MPLTDAQHKANAKYREKAIKRIPLDVPKVDYEIIKAHSEALGESVNGFVKRAISEPLNEITQASNNQFDKIPILCYIDAEILTRLLGLKLSPPAGN